jgi:hypothetical protein
MRSLLIESIYLGMLGGNSFGIVAGTLLFDLGSGSLVAWCRMLKGGFAYWVIR